MGNDGRVEVSLMRFSVGRKFFIVLLSLILSGGYAAMSSFPMKPGIHEQTVVLDNEEIRYTISIPKSISSSGHVPLVIALHYGGTVTPFYGGGYLRLLVEPALKGLKAIIVAPDCPGRGWTDPKSEKAVLGLLSAIQENYKIDSTRVLITGYSMGAIGTWYLASRHPHLFSAAVSISGMPNPKMIEKSMNTPVYVIQSRGDELFPMDSVNDFIGKIESRSSFVKLVIVKGLSHYQTSGFIEPLREAIPWIKQIWKHEQ